MLNLNNNLITLFIDISFIKTLFSSNNLIINSYPLSIEFIFDLNNKLKSFIFNFIS